MTATGFEPAHLSIRRPERRPLDLLGHTAFLHQGTMHPSIYVSASNSTKLLLVSTINIKQIEIQIQIDLHLPSSKYMRGPAGDGMHDQSIYNN